MDDRHRPGFAIRLISAIPGGHRVREKTQYLPKLPPVGGEGITQRMWHGQYPLPDGHMFRKYMVFSGSRRE